MLRWVRHNRPPLKQQPSWAPGTRCQ
jgi:hypothetical protein